MSRSSTRASGGGARRTMQRELLRLATTDPLTGLLNRRAFFVHAETPGRAGGRRRCLSAFMSIDIVHDVHGHDVGDAAIVASRTEARDGKPFSAVWAERNLQSCSRVARWCPTRLGRRRLPRVVGAPI